MNGFLLISYLIICTINNHFSMNPVIINATTPNNEIKNSRDSLSYFHSYMIEIHIT